MREEAELAPALLPPRADSDGTLRRIYEAALLRFAERGYHGVSVREIADACGIKASSLYAHLSSKHQLLYDLIRIGHEEHRDRLKEALLGSGSDPATQLRALAAAHVRFHAEYPVLATVANNELHALAPERAEEIQGIRDDDLRFFTDVIERGVRLERFQCDDPFLATAVIGAMGIRVAVWFPTRDDYSADDVVDSYAGFALKLVS